MPESTLSLKYQDLAGEVGLFLGYGRGADFGDPAWTTRQRAAIESDVRSGLRQFYFPPAVDTFPAGYDWSFMKPIASLTLLDGRSTVDLPPDFGGIEGDIVIQISSQSSLWTVPVIGEGRLLDKQVALPDTTGRPEMAAQTWLKSTGHTKGQRAQLMVWPIADQDYTLRVRYYVSPDAINDAFPYHMGGMVHAETVLESCLSVAEERQDDSSLVHAQKFRERLVASINYDRRFKSQISGYNGDRSDLKSRSIQSNHWRGATITYNDVVY